MIKIRCECWHINNEEEVVCHTEIEKGSCTVKHKCKECGKEYIISVSL